MLQIPLLPADWHHVHLPETDSTMLDLRRPPLSEQTAAFTLVTADFQTAGRGQRGTHWEAARGENLLFGIRCHPTFWRADRQFLLSEVQALAVAGELAELVGGITVKWPNDVYCCDRKICGMLLEHDLCGKYIATTVTGVGVNVNQSVFSGDAPNPVSLQQMLGRPTDRARLMSRIAFRFDALYRRLQQGGEADIHQAYLASLYRREGYFPYVDAGGGFSARLANVYPDGRLELCDEKGRSRIYAFKEVQFQLDTCHNCPST